MNRNPPMPVVRQLRSEVNYGCPVPGCCDPFLTWHHFDPPWEEREHHDPDGMVALCWKHHKMADAGTFSRDHLHQFKASPNDIKAISSKFEWLTTRLIIRLGGCYAPDWCRIHIGGQSVLRVRADQDGFFATDLSLRDDRDIVIATMTANVLSCEPASVHDLLVSASGHQIKIWLAERRIGVELEFGRRDVGYLERLLEKDSKLPKGMANGVSPPFPIGNPEGLYTELAGVPSFEDLIARTDTRHDPVGMLVRWHAARHRDSDGRIPLLNFKSCRLHLGKQTVEMRSGRIEGLRFCAANTFTFDGMRVTAA